MNTAEHIMVCGAEEAGEVAVAALAVAKALHKGLRFGLDDVHPGHGATAIEVLVAELNDLTATVEMLQDEGIVLPGLHDRDAIEAKKKRVRTWMDHAEHRGFLLPRKEGDR